eukprot:3263984-Pleurochrysis_carterae.AAC.1
MRERGAETSRGSDSDRRRGGGGQRERSTHSKAESEGARERGERGERGSKPIVFCSFVAT